MSRLAIIAAILQASTLVACATNGGAGSPGAGPSTSSWYLSAIGAGRAWSVSQGDGVLVAILDSGVSFKALPRVRRRAVEGFNAIDGSRNLQDESGHGTAVTSVAVGSGDHGVWGTAPRARLLPIVVADSHGQASPRDVAEGVRRAVALGAAIINLSLGSVEQDADLASAIAEANARQVIVVAASGDTASQARGGRGSRRPAVRRWQRRLSPGPLRCCWRVRADSVMAWTETLPWACFVARLPGEPTSISARRWPPRGVIEGRPRLHGVTATMAWT
jgi:hypothetical protein